MLRLRKILSKLRNFRNLADRDVFSKSDPCCIIYRVENEIPIEVARTETIKDCLSPRWSVQIRLDYFFERSQTLLFKIYDIDADTLDPEDHDFLGSASIDLADILAAPHGYVMLKLGGWKRAKGHLVVFAEEISEQRDDLLTFSLQGVQLPKRFLFVKPDPYLEFYKALSDGSYKLVHRTKPQRQTCYPTFPDIQLTVRDLCGNEITSNFVIQCHTTVTDGTKLIGEATTNYDEIVGLGSGLIPLINPRKKERDGYKDSGSLRILKFTHDKGHSFLEFVRGGMQLEFAVCVDFTASNGPIHSATSLHYLDGVTPTQYEMAIEAVLDICQHYNQSKEFDAMGFGAKIPPAFNVSHLFPLDLIGKKRKVLGVSGVLSSYRNALTQLELYGPTNFAPSIREFAYKASLMPKDGSSYQILLIITDGVITDMNRTLDAIVDASEQPLSIIIIGVGRDPFDKMDRLDSDQQLLTTAEGRVATRDIVQFVPFRNFLPPSGSFSTPAEAGQVQRLLAREVLEEVPDQVTGFMRAHAIQPGPARLQLAPDSDILSLLPRQPASPPQPQPSWNPTYQSTSHVP